MRRLGLLCCVVVIATAVSGCGGSAQHRVPGTFTFPPAAIRKSAPEACPREHATHGCVIPMMVFVRRPDPDPVHRFLAWLERTLRR